MIITKAMNPLEELTKRVKWYIYLKRDKLEEKWVSTFEVDALKLVKKKHESSSLRTISKDALASKEERHYTVSQSE